MDERTRQAILKFKLVSDFHKRIRQNKDNDDYGRNLTFLRIGGGQDVAITYRDIELIGALYDETKDTNAPV